MFLFLFWIGKENCIKTCKERALKSIHIVNTGTRSTRRPLKAEASTKTNSLTSLIIHPINEMNINNELSPIYKV